jgi:hypothetical protein
VGRWRLVLPLLLASAAVGACGTDQHQAAFGEWGTFDDEGAHLRMLVNPSHPDSSGHATISVETCVAANDMEEIAILPSDFEATGRAYSAVQGIESTSGASIEGVIAPGTCRSGRVAFDYVRGFLVVHWSGLYPGIDWHAPGVRACPGAVVCD